MARVGPPSGGHCNYRPPSGGRTTTHQGGRTGMADLRTARRTAEQLARDALGGTLLGAAGELGVALARRAEAAGPGPPPPRGPVRSFAPPRPKPPPWSTAPARKPPRPTPATRPPGGRPPPPAGRRPSCAAWATPGPPPPAGGGGGV